MPVSGDNQLTQAQTHLVLILGRRGIGKTYLAVQLASSWPYSHVFAFNPANDVKLRSFQQCSENRPPGFKDCLIILDELDTLVTPGKYLVPWVREACRRGRHHECSVVCCALRPQFLHRDFSTQCTRVYLGKMMGDRDLEYCARNWGDVCYQAALLDEREFLEIRP